MVDQITDKEMITLNKIINYKKLEPYFFDKLIEKKDLKWFDVLISRGFFDNDKIPIVSEGNYIERWNVLNYLISVMDKIVEMNDIEKINYIFDTLLRASEKSKNFRVFDQSVEIIIRIPISYINEQFITRFIDNWFVQNLINIEFIYANGIKLLEHLASNHQIILLVYKKFIKSAFELYSITKKDYIFYELLDKKNLLIEIFTINPIENIKIYIDLFESALFIGTSTRTIDKYKLTINNYNNKCELLLLNEVEKVIEKFSFNFTNREADIDLIIDRLKNKLDILCDEDIIRQIKLLYNDLFNYEAFTSILDQKGHLFDAIDYLNQFFNVIFTEAKMNNIILYDLISILLTNRYNLIKKWALFIIIKKWQEVSQDIIHIFKDKYQEFDYIFRSYIFDDETKHIFQLFDGKIETEYEILIDNIINKGDYFLFRDEEKNYEIIWKQKRYQALKNIPSFEKKLFSSKKITNIDVELSPAIQFTGVYTLEQISPFTSDQIKNMPIRELVLKMSTFRETRNFSPEHKEISYNGFGNEIKNNIINNPENYINSLKLFDELQYDFIAFILEAFSELLKKNRDLEYKNVVEFMNLYISKEKYWDDAYRPEQDTKSLKSHISVLKELMDYLIIRLSNDKVELNQNELDIIYQIILICRKRINFNKIEDVLFNNNDISFYVLNSLAGRYNTVLLEIALKSKRTNMENYKSTWGEKIKPVFEDLLKLPCLDTYVILGEYIAQFLYIDDLWIREKIELFKPENKMWQYFMTGYLDSRAVYYNCYELMLENYVAAIDKTDFVDKDVKEKLGTHIAIGYVNGFENKDNINIKLSELALRKWDISIIKTMIRYYYFIEKKNLVKEISMTKAKDSIEKFWTKIIEICSIKDIQNEEDKELLKEIVHLCKNFSKINEQIKNNLIFSFKYIGNSYESNYAIDYCEKLAEKDEDEKLVIDLIYELLNECVPTYPEEKIKKLIEYLNKKEEHKKLENIMMSYINKTRKSIFVQHISNLLNTNSSDPRI